MLGGTYIFTGTDRTLHNRKDEYRRKSIGIKYYLEILFIDLLDVSESRRKTRVKECLLNLEVFQFPVGTREVRAECNELQFQQKKF